ncbi:Cytochrome C, Planctomycete-type [Spirosomataceae bacterium]
MITEFIGKFHPLLVHLPIGFFLLAFVLKVISFWKNKESIEAILPIMLILSFLASAFSSLTGFLLSQSGEYDIEMVDRHQWGGIVFTVLILAVYFFRNNAKLGLAAWIVSTLLLMFVGHLGGSLTHGEDFLSIPQKAEKAPITDIQNAKVYADLVQPILEEKCYGCHSSKKQKGNLRLDSPEYILAGGKEGKSVVPHNTQQSLISKRIFMPEGEEEHMPPKGKPQLTEAEVKVLDWWIKEGASFDKLVKNFNQTPEIKLALLTFQGSGNAAEVSTASNIPEKEVEKGSEESIALLKNAGILALPVATNSNYLLINLRGIEPSEKDLGALKALKKQIVWLNASKIKNADALATILQDLNEIRVLHLNKTNFSDNGMAALKNLEHLQMLNLANTNITEKGLENIKGLNELRKVYLYQSKVQFSRLKMTDFPKIKLDTGGYTVPTLVSDTSLVKPPM